jgi:N6-adenosine-specific RNA methylase IME4
MGLDELCKLPVSNIAFDDALLFLWVPPPKLEEAMQVIRAWGFVYRTGAIWVKPTFGTGYYFRQQHEHLLVARRGEVPRPAPEKLCSSLIRAPRPGLHSAKPRIMYDIIERMYPGLRKIELFARGPACPGWTNWGLEAEGKEPNKVAQRWIMGMPH